MLTRDVLKNQMNLWQDDFMLRLGNALAKQLEEKARLVCAISDDILARHDVIIAKLVESATFPEDVTDTDAYLENAQLIQLELGFLEAAIALLNTISEDINKEYDTQWADDPTPEVSFDKPTYVPATDLTFLPDALGIN